MHLTRRAFVASSALLAPGLTFSQSEAAFPSKPIRILLGFSAGSPSDTLARFIALKMTAAYGQPVTVENRPSAGAIVASEAVARSPADGYTLLMVSAGHAATAALYKKLPYDTATAFTGVAYGALVPEILVVSPSFPVQTVAGVIRASMSSKEKLTFSSAGVGSATHLTAELFQAMTETEIQHIPYKGIPEAVNAVLKGEVTMMFCPISSALPMVKDNRLRAVAVTTAKRATLLPQLPTIAESGVKGYAFDPWFGLLAPAGTPKLVVDTLNKEANAALQSADIKVKLDAMGAEANPMSATAFDAYVKEQIGQMKKLVTDRRIVLD
ncbi:tripartite tricarboxylate transporter substrate binding protein [Variovorax sp. LT1R16]|uniref:tripartite tricarboxylate transporter substrate binding protein n=1 Tax=Variovorax sp. LT1R16 TaxID=3443728 RepID=UPI003F454C62